MIGTVTLGRMIFTMLALVLTSTTPQDTPEIPGSKGDLPEFTKGKAVPVDCHVTSNSGGIRPSDQDGTYIVCEGVNGYFVHYDFYFQLRRDHRQLFLTQGRLKKTEKRLRLIETNFNAMVVLANTQRERATNFKEYWEAERRLRVQAQRDGVRSWWEHQGIWVGIGFVGAGAAALVYRQLRGGR